MMRKIISRGKYVEIELEGPQQVSGVRDLFAELRSQIPNAYGKPLLVIGQRGDYNGEGIHRLATELKRELATLGTRMALVVKGDLQYGLGRMISARATEETTLFLPFRTREEALSWLFSPRNGPSVAEPRLNETEMRRKEFS